MQSVTNDNEYSQVFNNLNKLCSVAVGSSTHTENSIFIKHGRVEINGGFAAYNLHIFEMFSIMKAS